MNYRLYQEESNGQNTCGIEVIKNGKPLKRIPDITCDEKSLAELVALLNELGTDLPGLEYIIEDYLTFFEV